MKRHSMLVLFVLAILALAAVPAYADPGHGDDDDHGTSGMVTDDPNSAEDPLLGFDGSGLSHVEKYLGNQSPSTSSQRKARNFSLVGAAKGTEFNQGVFGDVMGYKNLAFLGKWRGGCPGSGVDIFDISTPSKSVKISDTEDYADTSMEDMQAIKIGNRDILAIGLQDCGNISTPGVGKSGLEIYDITNPRQPKLLSFFDVDQFGVDAGGVHELDVVINPSGRALAIGSVPDLEARTSDVNGIGGKGDLLIWDISNPANPTLIAEWGVLDEPTLGVPVYLNSRQGSDSRTQLHSARFNKDGTRAYLSYWDAGYIILDITDPSQPKYQGRAAFGPGVEGNAHSVDEARDGKLLIAADEDFSPFAFGVTSSAFTGLRPAVQGTFTKPLAQLPGQEMAGEVVHVGRGCPAGAINGSNPDDPYLADPAGKIALIERGDCSFSHKIYRAQQAGATGVVVYNHAAGGEGLVSMGNTRIVLPDGSLATYNIGSIFVQRSTGLLMRDGTPPVTMRIRAQGEFNGWGYLRFFDISDPANPKQLSTYATPNTNNEAVANSGTWSVHNPEVVGSIVYASWYSDGVRAIDFSNPSAPRELGFWTGAGAPTDAPAVNIWSAVPHNGLLLASDRNYGLYILKVNAGK
jgi:hypothetical protein